jgi:hypothetical protein
MSMSALEAAVEYMRRYGNSKPNRLTAEKAAAELARLQAIELAFFKIVSPDGFHQCGTYEDCPECESEGTHTPDCKLAAALDPK